MQWIQWQFSYAAIEVRAWVNNDIAHKTVHIVTYPCRNLSWINLLKAGVLLDTTVSIVWPLRSPSMTLSCDLAWAFLYTGKTVVSKWMKYVYCITCDFAFIWGNMISLWTFSCRVCNMIHLIRLSKYVCVWLIFEIATFQHCLSCISNRLHQSPLTDAMCGTYSFYSSTQRTYLDWPYESSGCWCSPAHMNCVCH